jgi:hypothetical protein
LRTHSGHLGQAGETQFHYRAISGTQAELIETNHACARATESLPAPILLGMEKFTRRVQIGEAQVQAVPLKIAQGGECQN